MPAEKAPAKKHPRKTGSSALKLANLKKLANVSPAEVAVPFVDAAVMTPAKKAHAKRTLKEELLALLRTSLRISVSDGGFTDPNSRMLKLTLDGEEVCSTTFNIRSRREYEG
jgi:hypothetical protein